jgi:hypothetical protein
MKTPITFVANRSVIATVFLILLVLIGLGFGGIGPFDGFFSVTNSIINWLETSSGVKLR